MKYLFLTAAALALLPVGVCAQNAGEIVIADERRDDIIVTAIGTDALPETVGQAITLITANDLRTVQIPSVSDILSRTPGITTTRNGGFGTTTAVRLRGAEGDQTLTLIDGVRVNDPSSPGGGFDFGNLLVGNIDRIEVLRGPNSVSWGSQAIGGVVNVITARPTETLSGNGRAEYGYRNKVNLVGNLAGGTEAIKASIGGGYFRDDGISGFTGGTERDGFRQYGANGRIEASVTDNLTLDVRGYFASGRTQIDGFAPPTFAFGDTPEFSEAQEVFGYAGARLALFDGDFKNRLAFTIADINRDNFATPAATAPSFLARGRTERFEYQGDARIGDGVRTVFGIEHERSRFADSTTRYATYVSSGYIQAIVDPVDTLTLTGGVRFDDHRDYGSRATLSANAAWRPFDGTIIRVAYGEGFKAPTLFQLNSSFGNRTLAPETARSFDVGIEQRIGDFVTAGVTLFRRNTRNQIDFVSCFGRTTGICVARPFGTYDNIRRARAQGIEAFIRATPTDALTFDANYSVIDAKDRDRGLALLRRPRGSLNLAVDWNAYDTVRIGASLQRVSESFDTDFQTFARARLGGYTLVGLRAAVPIGEILELYGRVDNVFDQDYTVVSGYGTFGRNAHVGVRARF